MMKTHDLQQRGRADTVDCQTAKKTGALWRWSGTILSGSRPQVLLYGPLGDAGPTRESGVKAGRPKKAKRPPVSTSRAAKHSDRKRTHTASRPKRRNVS